MEKRLRNRRILDIVLIILVIAAAGILFAKLFYNSSQKKVLSNLAEISNQSAKVFQREAEKGKILSAIWQFCWDSTILVIQMN